jgi:hypothetical protein
MQLAYSGRDHRLPSQACVRGHILHTPVPGASRLAPCSSRGGRPGVLEAVTPAGARASGEAIGELERQHD